MTSAAVKVGEEIAKHRSAERWKPTKSPAVSTTPAWR
jgi:hypothetical protein